MRRIVARLGSQQAAAAGLIGAIAASLGELGHGG